MVTSRSAPTTASCSSPTTARSTTSASCGRSSSRSGTRSTRLRHRGGAARLPRVGDRLLRPLQRHVGAGDPRPARRRDHDRAWCSPATTTASSRSTTRARVGPGAVRVGGQGGAGRSRARDGARPPVALRLPAARPPRPQAADRVRRHPGARRGHVGGGRRRRRARADVLDADAVDRRARPIRPSSAPASSARWSGDWSPTSPRAPACRAGSTRPRS